MGPLLLLAGLGGGAVVDGKYNDGNLTRAAADFVGDGVKGIFGGGDDNNTPGGPNGSPTGNKDDGGFDFMDILGNPFAQGAGLLGLWMMPMIPNELKLLATAAFVAFQVFKHFTSKKDFNGAARGETNDPSLQRTKEDELDFDNPEQFAAQGDGRHIRAADVTGDPSQEYEATNE